jgi:phenylacetic acid degradation operon negative regulatory protein
VDDVSPKTVLLDLLRVTPRPIPVRSLVAVGELFGFESNAMRVALTRLVRRGLVESDERGSYQLAPGASPISRLVDRWRDGDRRVRSWKGDWLCVLHPRGGGRAARKESGRALHRYGFREGLPGLWVRPDNLRVDRDVLRDELTELGLMSGAELFTGSGFAAALTDGWARSLWDLAALRKSYRAARRELDRSRQRLASIPPEDALVESFLAGGRAIRVLALDPLLPDEILAGDDRRALTDEMREFDRLGKSFWNKQLDAPALDGAPTHLAAVS